MAYHNRYKDTIRGKMTFTGNTVGLSKFEAENNEGQVASIGAFISLDTGLVVGNFPPGTTLDIDKNGSSAELVIPADSTIVYAELIWGGNYYGQNTDYGTEVDISNLIDNDVVLTTPLGSDPISIDNLTAENQTQTIGATTISFYERSQNVTEYIKDLGPGTHTISVEKVPGITEPFDWTTSATNHAGWTLAVVYANPTMTYRNMNLWVGGQIVRVGQDPVDFPISGFTTPSSGTINARLLASAQEGDADIPGDQLLFGLTEGTATPVDGPNNPIGNFFCSQINGDDGDLNTTGTFGDRNQDGFTQTNTDGGRQGWDITNIDVSDRMEPNQTDAYVGFSTVRDAYMPNALGVEIDVQSPTINITKTVDKLQGLKGDSLLYTLVITNNGTLATNNFHLTDAAPTGTTIDLGSINVINETGPRIDNSTTSLIDIELGPINVTQSVTVQFKVNTNQSTPTPVTNIAHGTYNFTPGVGQLPIDGDADSLPVETNLATVTQSKVASPSQALVGDIITYTVTIDNTKSAVDITNVYVYDNLQPGTSYVPSSTSIGGGAKFDSDPSQLPGISVVTVLAGRTQTVSFDVKINQFPAPNPIVNTANVSFRVGTSNATQPTNEIEVLVLQPSISIDKNVDLPLAQVGDTLTYTFRITNTGDTPLQNIIFDDPPPANTSFMANTFTIAGNPYAGIDPNNQINFAGIPVFPNIFPIAIGGYVDVSYQVKVDSLPNPPEINNIATVYYEVLVDNKTRRLNENSDEVTTDIFEINVAKTVNRVAAQGGDTIRYTSTVTTTIPGDYLSPVIFRDLAPAQTTLLLSSISVVGTSSYTNNSTANEVIINLGNTLPANPISISFDVTIDTDAASPIINTSQVDLRANVIPSNPIETFLVDPSVSKSSSVATALVGDMVTYTVTIDNTTGQAPITNVYVLDSLQAGTSYVNGSTVIGLNPPINSDPTQSPGIPVGIVPAGQSQTVSFKVRIDTLPTPNPVLNRATVNYKVDGVDKTLTTGQTSILIQSPDIQVQKHADKPFAQVGETIVYTSIITNTGTVNIDNIIFTDVPPTHTTYDGLGVTIQTTNYPALNPSNLIDVYSINSGLFPLVPGASISISYGAIVDTMPNPPIINNISTVDYLFTVGGQQKRYSENSSPASTQIYELNLDKKANKTEVEGGDTIAYTITLTSNISGNIGETINFIDMLPAETLLVDGSVDVLGLATYTNNSTPTEVNLDLGTIIPPNPIVISFEVRVNQNAIGPILNTSLVDINQITTPSNQARTDIVKLIETKLASVPEAEVGEVITYFVTIDNSQSDVSVQDVYVFDNLQLGTSYVNGSTIIDGNIPIDADPSIGKGIYVGTVLAKDVIEVSFDVRIDVYPNPNPVLNTALVNYMIDGEEKSKPTNETEVLVQQPDIQVTKSVDKPFAKVGDTLTYTVVTKNTGTVDLQNLIFTDKPPLNTVYDGLGVTIETTNYPGLDPNNPINIGSVNPALFPVTKNGTITVSFGVIVTNMPTPPFIENIGTIDYFYLINGGTRKREESNKVQTRIFSLDIEKTANHTVVERGNRITFSSTITSDITGDIGTDIIFKDLVPTGTSLVDGSIDVIGLLSYIDNSTSTEVILNLGQVLPPNPIVVTFEVEVDNDATETIKNKSMVETSGLGIESNEVEVDLVILDSSKSVSVPEAEVGEIITYKVTIDNSQGTGPMEDVFIFDNLQSGTSYVNGTTIIGVGTPIDSDPSIPPGIEIGIVAAGDKLEVLFNVRIDSMPNPNKVLNTADINYKVDGVEKSQTTGETEVLVQQPDIKVTKSVDKLFAKVGDTLTYTVVTKNTGTVDLQNLIFTDKPPLNTVYDGLGVTIETTNYPGLDPNNPINIGSVNPALFPVTKDGTITVSFGVIVTNMPTPPFIENIGTIDYFYLINGGTRKREESNKVQTRIFSLDIEKSANTSIVEKEDIITFRSTITSDITGNIGTDIIFRDLVPSGTSLVDGSIDVVGIPSFIDNSTDTEVILDLGKILPPNAIIVTFDVLVEKDTPGIITNTSEVETNKVGVNSNEVSIDVVVGKFIKQASVTSAEVGETITYFVTIDNSQNSAPMDKVFIVDKLQDGTSYVHNSTVIGPNPPIDADPSIGKGISVGTIAAGDSIIVSFDVKIDELTEINPVLNTADINYELDGRTKSKLTNETDVFVYNPKLTIVKEASDEFVQVGDTIVYTSTITNTGSVDIENILFTDKPPLNTTYDGLGVSINTTNYPLLNPNNSIDIKTVDSTLFPLKPGNSIKVSFGATVTSVPEKSEIKNTSGMTYEYVIDGETKSQREESLEVITKVIDLTLVKSVNPTVAQRLDIVKFTTTITSNVSGNISTPIVFKDVIPTGTELIEDSIKVTGSGFENNSTTNEVILNLGTVLPPNPIVVSFDVKILDSAQSPIKNTSLVEIKSKQTKSNEVKLDLVILNVSKSTADNVVAVGENITYTVLLDNTLGTADATEVFLLDLLQSGTSYVPGSTSINGGPLANLDPSTPPGIFIGTIPSKTAVSVKFDVSVDEKPTNNPILNTATISYKAGNKQTGKTTNEVKVNVVDIEISKSVTPKFAQVGDSLVYTSTITNTGKVPINSIVFKDPPPTNTIYDDPSFKINHVLYPTLNPTMPIDLGLVDYSLLPLNPGDYIIIEYSVFVDKLPDAPVVNNTSSIDYTYLDGSITKKDTKDSNPVDTVIREGEIKLKKSADKDVVLVGDTLTYTINVKNTGNIECKNVILTDIVPPETEFIDGSVIVNGASDKSLNPNKGINLGTIPAPKTYIVSFKVRVLELPVLGEIINSTQASYDVFVNPDGPPVKEDTISNDVITKVEDLSISIDKVCNPECVSVGEEINFEFTIVNNGTVDISHIKLYDEIPEETSFVQGSFIGSTGVVTADDLVKGVYIGSLQAGKTKEVSFKVKLETIICGLSISNKASINYKYTLDDGKTYETSSSDSNECSVDIKTTSFTQSFYDGIFDIPEVKLDMEDIVDLDVNFICGSHKIIDTPIGISEEGQSLTGKKLIVNGKLCLTLTYVAEVETQTVHNAHFEVPVCEYVVIPNGIDIDCNINPKVYIEDIFFEKVNKRQLFVNIAYLVESGV